MKETAPQPGWTTEAKVVRVIDADTLEVEVVRRFAIRLVHPNPENKHFNSPEKNTPQGEEAKAYAEDFFCINDRFEIPNNIITAFIPSNQAEKLMDFNSFNRVLGEVWVGDKRFTAILLEEGYGKLVKK
jgi:endonuclease YncB( thermonuclease family)